MDFRRDMEWILQTRITHCPLSIVHCPLPIIMLTFQAVFTIFGLLAQMLGEPGGWTVGPGTTFTIRAFESRRSADFLDRPGTFL